MNFHIVTLFPETIQPYLDSSILGRAQKSGKITVNYYNPRDFTRDKHRTADDRAYGGGPGMVMKAEPVLRAVKKAKGKKKDVKIFITAPGGKKFDEGVAQRVSKKYRHVIIICGHYEGIDARVKKILQAEEISIGEYVLTGGELPALVMVDALARKITGVLGNEASLEEARTASPEVYTRPETIKSNLKNYRVPNVLLSGDHKKIESWRKNQKDKNTKTSNSK